MDMENIKAAIDHFFEENRDACLAMLGSTGAEKGLEICRKYYEFYGKPMLEAQFSEYLPQMAIGLSGEGSDCFGYDDEVSRDHDWGPSFCIWIPRVLYEKIGKQLQEAYMALPDELDGIKRAPVVQGAKRRGVLVLEDYLADFGLQVEEPLKIDWEQMTDASLACLTNGEIWRDDAAILTSYRQVLQQGYPEPVLFCKIAEAASRFSQAGQYNLLRAKAREDRIFASICISDAMREAMKLLYYMNNLFPPHDKWLGKGMESIPGGDEIKRMLEQVCNAQIQENRLCEASARAEESAYGSMGVAEALEQLGAFLAQELYRRDFISDVDAYLDHHAPELLQKAIDAQKDEKELAMEIARQEFAAFDKVDNEGGRASCQNNWPTFSVMRRSQYLTWTKTMQLQYLYDFRREMSLGHNLITEKYGRMMESTAPERYEEIKVHFQLLSEEKKNIIEQIVQLQVAWMEAFAEEYPRLAGQARSIHTYEDNAYNTSYETYLRGEISTYSDKMLELYARFIVEHAQSGRNLAYETMENSCKLYGYESLDAAEEKQEL